jgi:hypothetical protein
MSKQRYPLLNIGLGYVSGSNNKQPESKEPVKMIKFQVSRQSDHVSTLAPKANKDKTIPDKKQRYRKIVTPCFPQFVKITGLAKNYGKLINVNM